MHVYATEYHNLSHLELADQALDTFGQALRALPARKDPARQEPILEPIIRIVFTLNKMVARHEMIVSFYFEDGEKRRLLTIMKADRCS